MSLRKFDIGGEVWRIDRAPAQSVPSKRGAGRWTSRAASVVLDRVGAPCGALHRKAEVAARVEELVGLTKDQFEQVVLIPQGRFEEVLKADTSKRAPLLRRLFPVEPFTRVVEQLKVIAAERVVALDDRARDLAAAAEEARRSFAQDALAVVPEDVETSLSPGGVRPGDPRRGPGGAGTPRLPGGWAARGCDRGARYGP